MNEFKKNPAAFLISFRFQDLNSFYGKAAVLWNLKNMGANTELTRHITNLVQTYGIQEVQQIVKIMYSPAKKKASNLMFIVRHVADTGKYKRFETKQEAQAFILKHPSYVLEI